jgi:hypothetical protein
MGFVLPDGGDTGHCLFFHEPDLYPKSPAYGYLGSFGSCAYGDRQAITHSYLNP